MAAIFDAPVAPVGAENLLGFGLLGGPTGETIGDFMGIPPGFFLDGFPFDEEGLSDVREIEVGV